MMATRRRSCCKSSALVGGWNTKWPRASPRSVLAKGKNRTYHVDANDPSKEVDAAHERALQMIEENGGKLKINKIKDEDPEWVTAGHVKALEPLHSNRQPRGQAAASPRRSSPRRSGSAGASSSGSSSRVGGRHDVQAGRPGEGETAGGDKGG